MEIQIVHSIPGRLRLRYNRRKLTQQQAVLAQTLIAVQDGISDIQLNPKTGSFLVLYDVNSIAKKEVLALFYALSDKYLADEELLESVADVPVSGSIFNVVVGTAFAVFMRSLLPLPIRNVMLYRRILPRIGTAVSSVRAGHFFSTDLLDAVALSTAVLSGNTDTARSISTLLQLGEDMEEITRRQSYDNLAKTLLISNEPAHLLVGKEEKNIAPSALKKGDSVIVRMGEQIPADGAVTGGAGLVNQASITGEPLPVEKSTGKTVFAGTVVQEGELVISVHSAGDDTKVKNIIAMIDDSQNLKANAQKRSEAFAEKVVPFNFLLTAATYFFTRDITKTIATLMIDYSCGMKLTSPIAVLAAMKEAAEAGISVKGGIYFEEVARADTVIFDKTGTLTYASPVLRDVYALGTMPKDEVLRLAACLEEHFPHPLGRAVVKGAEEKGLVHPEEHTKVEYIVAHGIASSLNGKKVCIGSAHFVFEDEGVPLTAEVQAIQKEALNTGCSLLYLAVDGALEGILAIDDPVRPDAKQVIADLKAAGIKQCIMITGDTEGAAKKIAAECGIDRCYFQALPEDKVRYVSAEREKGHRVIMIGDGINDAPALSAAHAGIAVDGCSSIAGDTADIVLSEAGLESLVLLRRLSTRLFQKINRNNHVILGGNSALLAGGMLGYAAPKTAAVLHNGLTVGVSMHAARPLLPQQKRNRKR